MAGAVGGLRDTTPCIPAAGVVAYAGVPLMTRTGHALGTLCVIDRKPRSWTSEQIETLKTLGAAALAQIELRVASQPA